MIQIVPSIFAADFTRLGEEIRRVEQAGVEMIHVDIMDGHFVPNFTMGTPITESIRRFTHVKLDHHLMIEDPDTYAPIFIKAGADCVSVHYEVCRNLDRTLHMIQDHGAKAGVVINPATPVSVARKRARHRRLRPGDERQSGIWWSEVYSEFACVKFESWLPCASERKLDFAIEIDGGVGRENIAEVARAGVDWVVAGSSVFGSADPRAGGSRYAANLPKKRFRSRFRSYVFSIPIRESRLPAQCSLLGVTFNILHPQEVRNADHEEHAAARQGACSIRP